MLLSDFDYELPPERIAQRPPAARDAARMLVLDRPRRSWTDRTFRELPELLRGDELLVLNNARVIPARLFGRRHGVRAEAVGKHTGSQFLQSPIEVLLTRPVEPGVWEALVRPGRKVPVGERLVFGTGELEAEVVSRGELGARRLRFAIGADLPAALERLGHIPLPPYIRREDEPEDRERYQTVYARRPGAVAAPTAGLHFTAEIFERIRARGAEVCEITLDVGPGTFQPVRTEVVEQHVMRPEAYEVPEAAAEQIGAARAAGRPILAVGTTVVRALEAAARRAEQPRSGTSNGVAIEPGRSEADLYIYPGHRFRVVDQMLTNFHLPRSTLLLLVCAFGGRELVLDAYRHAVAAAYRFYSYGDCMLIR